MSAKKKTIAIGLFLGIFGMSWAMGMSVIFPPEIFFFDKAVDQSIQTASAEKNQVRVIKENSVLRIKPKDDCVVIKKLPLGALLDVEEESGDWLKIKLPADNDGFVLTGYLHRLCTEKGSIIHE
jgi:hypothetical protein